MGEYPGLRFPALVVLALGMRVLLLCIVGVPGIVQAEAAAAAAAASPRPSPAVFSPPAPPFAMPPQLAIPPSLQSILPPADALPPGLDMGPTAAAQGDFLQGPVYDQITALTQKLTTTLQSEFSFCVTNG